MATTNPFVVDASIGVKWVFEEEDSNLARALAVDARRMGRPILVPPHFHVEVLNATWRKVARGLISPDAGLAAIDNATDYPTLTVSPPSLSRVAYEVALELRPGAIYDLLYVALAQVVGCELWTADARLARALRPFAVTARVLSTYTP